MSKTKNPAAVALGRKGGKTKNPRKGFGSLAPEARREAARKAATARWAKKGRPKAAQLQGENSSPHRNQT